MWTGDPSLILCCWHTVPIGGCFALAGSAMHPCLNETGDPCHSLTSCHLNSPQTPTGPQYFPLESARITTMTHSILFCFLSIYLSMVAWGLHCCLQAFSSCTVGAAHCSGFSHYGAQTLEGVGIRSCGSWALEHVTCSL